MSNSTFEHWWSQSGQWVEPPNERRSGWSGVLRVSTAGLTLYVKRQRNHLCRTFLHPIGWPTASREWHYLNMLSRLGIHAPSPVFHGVRQSPEGLEAILVTEELRDYRSLDQLEELPQEARQRIAQVLGTSLGRLHRARLQHSCLYDKHVMVRLNGDAPPTVALIDLEKMRPRLTQKRAAKHDLQQLKRRQHFFSDDNWETLLEAHRCALAAEV